MNVSKKKKLSLLNLNFFLNTHQKKNTLRLPWLKKKFFVERTNSFRPIRSDSKCRLRFDRTVTHQFFFTKGSSWQIAFNNVN